MPDSVAVDSHGDVWVSDYGNNRVLEYIPGTAPCAAGQFCDGMPASIVLGQPDLLSNTLDNSGFGGCTGVDDVSGTTTPCGLDAPGPLAFDSLGDLWVADTGNDRVLSLLRYLVTLVMVRQRQ